MADQAAHRAQAISNRTFAQTLLQQSGGDPTALQWAVTAAFYCAVHCIEAHLATYGATSTSHDERKRKMRDPAYAIPAHVYTAYRQLERHSRGARYYMQRFNASYVQSEILDQDLSTVTSWASL